MTNTSLTDSAQRIGDALEQQLQNHQIEVPMLPEVAGRVVTLAQDPESDAAQLSSLIQSDQSLAGHVMRIANSAAYTPNASLVSLQQAIARLGINLISEIALAASINSKMFSTPGFETHSAFIWRHALATALWSKEASRIARSNVEAAFLCGLLHSIGRPVALQSILEQSSQLNISLTPIEVMALVDRYHQQVGLQVIQQWEMPSIVCDVIEYFHHYEDSAKHTDITAMVHFGSLLATYMLAPDNLSIEALLEHPILDAVNLYQDEIDQLLDKQDIITSTMNSMQG